MNTPTPKIRWIHLLLIALTGAVLSCAGTDGPVAKDLAPGESAPSELDFFDSSRFDSRLSDSLKIGHDQVTTRMIGKVSVNAIPERIDKWFFMIEKHGGTVELQATGPEGRGLFTDLISLTVGAYNAVKEKMLYDPASEYNARVFYDPETAMIERVVFVEKEPGNASSN